LVAQTASKKTGRPGRRLEEDESYNIPLTNALGCAKIHSKENKNMSNLCLNEVIVTGSKETLQLFKRWAEGSSTIEDELANLIPYEMAIICRPEEVDLVYLTPNKPNDRIVFVIALIWPNLFFKHCYEQSEDDFSGVCMYGDGHLVSVKDGDFNAYPITSRPAIHATWDEMDERRVGIR
jgi:hypothetical protein